LEKAERGKRRTPSNRLKSQPIEITGAPYGIRRGAQERPVKSEELRLPAVLIDTAGLYHRPCTRVVGGLDVS
jgi:hypothetical protein